MVHAVPYKEVYMFDIIIKSDGHVCSQLSIFVYLMSMVVSRRTGSYIRYGANSPMVMVMFFLLLCPYDFSLFLSDPGVHSIRS